MYKRLYPIHIAAKSSRSYQAAGLSHKAEQEQQTLTPILYLNTTHVSSDMTIPPLFPMIEFGPDTWLSRRSPAQIIL